MQVLRRGRGVAAAAVFLITAVLAGAASGLLATCGPFTDAAADAFCPFVLEIFYLGITTGTTPTTFDPGSNVSRLQMAAFLSRTVDGALKRGSRRAALDQFWTAQNATVLGLTTLGAGSPWRLRSDGADLWLPMYTANTVNRVRASDGKLLETWTGAGTAYSPLVAMGRVFVTGAETPGRLYRIDPSQPAGAVTTVASNLGNLPVGSAFDGARVWTANTGGSVSIVTPGATLPWTVTTVATGFSFVKGMVFDGTNIWVTDGVSQKLSKLDGNGAILQTVTVGAGAEEVVFDGTNLWVSLYDSNSIAVVRASTGAILATLTGNGLNGPVDAAFDGQRVVVTNDTGNSVSLWKAAGFSPLGSVDVGKEPGGACSDGITFWVTLVGSPNQLARF